ncbi:MAG: MMPL family transporter [Candidatus Saccharimonadales bacterium]
MGEALQSLGRWAFENSWKVIVGWVVVIALLAGLAMYFMKPTSSIISIPGTEAQKALDRVGELFPDAGQGSARIVVAAPEASTISQQRSSIDALTRQLSEIDGVTRAVSPFENTSAIAKDDNIAYIQLQLTDESGAVSEDTIDAVEQAVNTTRASGLTVEVGGDVIDRAPGEIIGVGEVGGVVLALVVLLMTLGSLVAAGMPIATALVAVAVSMGGLFGLSQVITISTTTPVLAVMLGLAVGIDYSLFIINKYRTYAKDGYAYKDAAARALGTAGNAVIFAAATVVIALAALSVVQIPFMTTMGLAGAATIALAAIVAITLIPALLGLAGERVFSRRSRKEVARAQAKGPRAAHTLSHKKFWYKWGHWLTTHPIVALSASIVLIGVMALPVRDLTLGLPTDEYAASTTTQRKAYDLLAKGFGVGFNGPLLVVVEGLPAVDDADKAAIRDPAMKQYEASVAEATARQQALFQQQAALATTPEAYALLQQEIAKVQVQGEVQQAAALAEIDKNVQEYAKFVQLKKVADTINARDDVAQVLPAIVTDDGTKGVIQIIPTAAPSDQATSDLIAYLRDANNRVALTGTQDVQLAVTGSTALQNDINAKLAAALPQYLAVVVGLSLVLLVVAFRSILVPIKATIGFLLSVLAMFGAMVAVFQWGWFGIAETPGPLVSFIPIIAIGILFGLAMDYEFFLVSSMHEAYQRSHNAKEAVVSGFALGSKVVTAAGVIMVTVFAGFVSNHDATIQSIGFGLAFGILIDAFIVRMTIVPAVMTLLGKSAWWLPRWLDRIVPHISIEGDTHVGKK